MSNLKPSEKAIDKAYWWWKNIAGGSLVRDNIKRQIEEAYAIDVDPLIEAKDKEIERWKEEARINDLANDVAQEKITELEWENARLKDLLETYCPVDERPGTPDQTKM